MEMVAKEIHLHVMGENVVTDLEGMLSEVFIYLFMLTNYLYTDATLLPT